MHLVQSLPQHFQSFFWASNKARNFGKVNDVFALVKTRAEKITHEIVVYLEHTHLELEVLKDLTILDDLILDYRVNLIEDVNYRTRKGSIIFLCFLAYCLLLWKVDQFLNGHTRAYYLISLARLICAQIQDGEIHAHEALIDIILNMLLKYLSLFVIIQYPVELHPTCAGLLLLCALVHQWIS